jgi:hypothetical protein
MVINFFIVDYLYLILWLTTFYRSGLHRFAQNLKQVFNAVLIVDTVAVS